MTVELSLVEHVALAYQFFTTGAGDDAETCGGAVESDLAVHYFTVDVMDGCSSHIGDRRLHGRLGIEDLGDPWRVGEEGLVIRDVRTTHLMARIDILVAVHPSGAMLHRIAELAKDTSIVDAPGGLRVVAGDAPTMADARWMDVSSATAHPAQLATHARADLVASWNWRGEARIDLIRAGIQLADNAHGPRRQSAVKLSRHRCGLRRYAAGRRSTDTSARDRLLPCTGNPCDRIWRHAGSWWRCRRHPMGPRRPPPAPYEASTWATVDRRFPAEGPSVLGHLRLYWLQVECLTPLDSGVRRVREVYSVANTTNPVHANRSSASTMTVTIPGCLRSPRLASVPAPQWTLYGFGKWRPRRSTGRVPACRSQAATSIPEPRPAVYRDIHPS